MSKLAKLILTAAVAAGVICPQVLAGGSGKHDRYEGLSGRELADAVRADFAPQRVPTALPFVDYMPDDWPRGWMPAPWPADGSRIGYAVVPDWFGAPILDMYNLLGSSELCEIYKADYPPGELTQTEASGYGWDVGIGEISGIATNMWQPWEDRRGDLARRIMYMALMYPQPLWHGRAVLVMADGNWPLLNTYGRELLGKWHREDAPDERELAELAAIESLQGNANPFVAIPDLYDYLWGDSSGQGYVPDEKRERVPLKGEYSREADGTIDLYSPYIPDGAEWAFDGVKVVGDTVSLSGISTGWHVISYTNGAERGRLKVNVKQ